MRFNPPSSFSISSAWVPLNRIEEKPSRGKKHQETNMITMIEQNKRNHSNETVGIKLAIVQVPVVNTTYNSKPNVSAVWCHHFFLTF
jgi:hypothetical protein